MYRKTIISATLAMLTSLAVYADTVYDATPADNQASFLPGSGQTFRTGTLTENELTYITVDSRLSGANPLWTDVHLAVYENDGGSVSNWSVGTLVGVSTNGSDMLSFSGETAVWHFNNPVLADNTDYLFMFVNASETPIEIGVGLKGGSDTTDGSCFDAGTIPFGGDYDVACLVSTDTTVPPLPGPPVTITSFTATPTIVSPNNPVTLAWTTVNADTVTLLPGVGDVTGLANIDVVITTNITYSLIAANTSGSVTSTVTVVSTPPATITSFEASETSVLSNTTVSLSWVTEYEDTLILLPGDIDVFGTTFLDVLITEDITYTLIASNAYGSATNTVFVNVEEPPEPPKEDEVTYSYGYIEDGVDDADHAGPMFGQGITITDPTGTLSTNEAALPQSVSLTEVTFQMRSPNQDSAATVVYLHVYDDFGVDGSASPTNIGNLVAVSTNALDFTALPALSPATWLFDNDALDKDTQYHYIVATNTTAATVADSSNLVGDAGFELNVGNPYKGGDAWRANGATYDWDMEFILTFTLDSPTGNPVTDLMISGPVSGGTAMVISWTSELDKPYGVQTNSNLIVADWQDWLTGQIGNGSILSVTNTIGPDETFYRVISE